MKIVLIHDFLNQTGGGERVLETFHEIYPEAPVYTSIYDKKRMPEVFKSMDIRTSFMQHFPLITSRHKPYLPFYPSAFESFNLKDFDIIFSSSSAFAKGVKVPKEACHICYCHTPMRFVWMYENYIEREEFGPVIKALLPLVIKRLKEWDIKTSATVDYFIANSRIVQKRIKDFYGRDSTVINPPVETQKFKLSNVDSDYYLIVSRLNPYKKLEIAVEAFNALRLPLKIVGVGPYDKVLKRLAKDNIKLLGRVSDRDLAKLYSECKALIFPGEEDFGIAPLEAMSSGRPVIAYKGGGALETIIGDETGIFFEEHKSESLTETIRKFQSMGFDKARIRDHALLFDKELFKKRIKEFVEEKYNEK